ncbi:hypothetical protein ACMD2_07252, partial [Ananas comosus]
MALPDLVEYVSDRMKFSPRKKSEPLGDNLVLGAPSAPKPGTVCGPPCGPDLQVVLVARHSGVLDDNPLHAGIGWLYHPKRRLIVIYRMSRLPIDLRRRRRMLHRKLLKSPEPISNDCTDENWKDFK